MTQRKAGGSKNGGMEGLRARGGGGTLNKLITLVLQVTNT